MLPVKPSVYYPEKRGGVAFFPLVYSKTGHTGTTAVSISPSLGKGVRTGASVSRKNRNKRLQ